MEELFIWYQEEEAEGVDTGETPNAPVPDTPKPPPTEPPEGDPECPGPLDPRIGALGPSEKERLLVTSYNPILTTLIKKYV